MPVPALGQPDTVKSGIVAAVIDGDTVVLKSGVQVRLVGIQAPKLPLGRAGFKPWPLAEKAKIALEALVLGEPVTLSYGGRRVDRHRRLLAHLERRANGTGDPVWIQGEMLSKGLARVYSFPDNRSRIDAMLAREKDARARRRGLWALRHYRILSPHETPRHIDSFQLVEGRILAAAVVRRRGYLNFGQDWRRDFTISIAPRDRGRFKRAGIDIAGLAGRAVRIRGWINWRNGPMIEATHPEQLELLDR